MNTIIGIIIFAIPFILVKLFKDKTIGFLTIFTGSFLVHLIVALTTQYFQIFNYSTIILIYLPITIIAFFIYYFNKDQPSPKENIIVTYASVITPKTIERVPIKTRLKNIIIMISVCLAFCVVFLNLLFVHYNFSGTVNTFNRGEIVVEETAYPYPYFSDEWVAISFMNYTIKNSSLPIVRPMEKTADPITGEGYFKNPLVLYFSFLSDIFLFFNLSPLNDFVPVTFFVGFTICIVFFMLLLSLGIDKRVAIITLLIIPYITNGGNLPGIWFLIPMTFSLIFYLISLIAFAKENNKLLFLSSLMCLCLYPPFIAFVLPVLIALLFRNKIWGWKKIIFIFTSVLFAFVLIGFVVFKNINPYHILETLRMYLFRYNLVGGILSFPIWIVLPVFVLPFAFIGLWPAFKKKLYFIILPLAIGLIYWFVYSDTEKVFIIDSPRVVVITSFLVLVFFALTVDFLLNIKVGNKIETENMIGKILSILLTLVTIVSILIATYYSLEYTKNRSWVDLKMQLNQNPKGEMSYPAPTVSEFLTEDDLRLFKGIESKTFLSPPWKGLVISAATGNYPLATKPSTVDVFTLNYYDFLALSCEEKQQVSTKYNMDYLYSEKIDCPNFIPQGTSSEGLILYKYEK